MTTHVTVPASPLDFSLAVVLCGPLPVFHQQAPQNTATEAQGQDSNKEEEEGEEEEEEGEEEEEEEEEEEYMSQPPAQCCCFAALPCKPCLSLCGRFSYP